MRRVVIAICLVAATLVSAAAQIRDVQVREITGSEFVGGFKELKGQTIKVTDCVIAGITQMFIRCETPANDGPSYAIETATMATPDLRWALAICPTGSWNKAVCRDIAVVGEIANRASPQLLRAHFDPPRMPPSAH